MSERQKRRDKQNMWLSLLLWVVLCGGCMWTMLQFAADKTIVIADVSQDQVGLSVGASQIGDTQQDTLTELKLTEAAGMAGSFCVPLPAGIRPENVFMENRYMDRQLWIYVQSSEVDFFDANAIYGDVSSVLRGYTEVSEDTILLKLEMADLMEYRSTLDGNVLTIACNEPKELYDFLVVLDPAGGGSDAEADGSAITEDELALEVARQVQRKFAVPNVRLYLTRTENVEVSEQARVEFVEAVGADLYIRVGAQEDVDNPGTYGVLGCYNEEYFIPGFGNADLADVLTRQVTIVSSNRAEGIIPAAGDSILQSIRIPAAELFLGYLSNPQEEVLLEQEFYQQRLAEGIVSAVGEACERLRQLQEE